MIGNESAHVGTEFQAFVVQKRIILLCYPSRLLGGPMDYTPGIFRDGYC